MRASSLLVVSFSGLLSLVSGDAFIVSEKSSPNGPTFQGCFVDGHDWWFCSKWITEDWKSYHDFVQVGCGYGWQINPERIVNVTTPNGCFASHGHLEWNDERDNRADYETQLTTDWHRC